MKFKQKFTVLYETIDNKFKEQFGFNIKETKFTNVVNFLHAPKDASSLAVTRILFGLAMLFDIPDERGGARLYKRWGNPKMCHFPLFSFIQAVPMPFMTLVYAGLLIGALGIMLGYKYRGLASLFAICYWYLFLIEKSYWNNHSYLFGLVSLLLTFTQANCYWSLDAVLEPEKFSETVPYWNYFILKYQFFILYFMAGVKKGSAEWLTGYSVPNLSAHWVFTPFTLFLSIEQTDYIIVHWFIFLFDLTVAFWMMWSRTRHVAMIFCALFHLMNSRLFTIGMFPWVCLATMPLFYPFNWPKVAINFIKLNYMTLKYEICLWMHKNLNGLESEENVTSNDDNENGDDNAIENNGITLDDSETKDKISKTSALVELKRSKTDQAKSIKTPNQEITSNKIEESQQDKVNKIYKFKEVECRKKITTVFIIVYTTMQLFLPFSHFITKGYNNWTDGLYGYSWDMMVHTWDVQSVVIKVVDNEEDNYFFMDPNAYSPNDRWLKHGDMVQQYIKCLHNNLLKESAKFQKERGMLSKNISIYVDVWCSMNGRFVQRMFDPYVDILQVSWSTFQRISFLMPLLDEASEWRTMLNQIRNDVHSWSQYSNVIFFADFPDHVLEKYIPPELSNVTLTILEGKIAVEPDVNNLQNCQSFQLNTGYSIQLDSGMFHRILNIGKKPAYYMFTFYNKTEANLKNDIIIESIPKLPIITELENRFNNMLVFADMLLKGFYQLFFRL